MEESLPYDSERMPSRLGMAISEIATQSPRGEGREGVKSKFLPKAIADS